MSRRIPGPPRLAERLLSATLEPRRAETILGDLHEEHARRAATSRVAASVWYSTQATRSAPCRAVSASNAAARFRLRKETP